MLNRKRDEIVFLLIKIAFCELLCKSFGQGILQAYILSQKLGSTILCLPTLDMKSNSWSHMNNRFTSYSTETGAEVKSKCVCDLWVAKGLEHCYPSIFLAQNNPNKSKTFPLMDCFISDCYSSTNTWNVIFPCIQLSCSVLQISFSMTHLGAVKNLKHVASFLVPWKIGFFYLITSVYFVISIGTSLLLCTYLANYYKNPSFQLLAFLSLFRLVLPEATSLKHVLPSCFLRILSVLLPLVSHFPLYYMMYNKWEVDGGCTLLAVKNRVTIHLHKNKSFGHLVAAYHLTNSKVETAVIASLRNMSFFPVDVNTLPVASRMPSLKDEAVFNVRNNFNVFGHFFLWNGTLIATDLFLTIGFLCYWTFVVQPHQLVRSLNIPLSKPADEFTKEKFRRYSI